MKEKFIAYYAANNELEHFETEEEAEKWLQGFYSEDGVEDGFAEETIDGQDFIAKIIKISKFEIIANRETDEYVWDNEEGRYITKNGEEWPYSDSFDCVGEIKLVKNE